jgi:hypothetical protein
MQMKISKLNLILNISAVFKLYLVLLAYIFLNKFELRFKSIKPNSVLLYILITSCATRRCLWFLLSALSPSLSLCLTFSF